jgi:dipeptidyl aminopeptidase/acylaminoacyl peptidase
MRRFAIFTMVGLALVALAATSAAARPRGMNGKIVTNTENVVTGTENVYTVDPDGTNERLLARKAEVGQWSPDGTLVALFRDVGERLFNVNTHRGINLGLPDTRYPQLALYCGVWSPDGRRLACEGFGQTDPGLNGVYTVRASDGGGLRRVTSEPNGDDCPSDYSPNGKRLIVTRSSQTSYGLYTVQVNGKGEQRIISNMDFNFCNGSWSPRGNKIVFSAHVPNAQDYHSSIWVIQANGTGLRRLPIAGPCGGLLSDPTTFGCFNPVWSPDGRKIAFGRNIDDGQRDIYTVNADGSHLFRVTHTPHISEFNGDWGTHQLTP